MVIAPSILNADNLNLDDEIKQAIAAGISRFHIDIMDGHFVPNLSFGPQLVTDFKREFPMIDAEIHLMSDNPKQMVPLFVKAGADLVELHYEAMSTETLTYWLDYLRANNVNSGLVLNPETPVSVVAPFLPKLKQVLLMTVKPGFGAQAFIPESLAKISRLRQLAADIDIEVDGGINALTAKQAREAGANVFVAGSYIFKKGNISQQIYQLKESIK
jgi:ribulose-phosphate 3-epimerase